MEILIEIYSFSLYVVWDMLCCICHTGHKCCMGQSLIQFCENQIEFITKICVSYIGCVGYLENMNCLLVSILPHLAA